MSSESDRLTNPDYWAAMNAAAADMIVAAYQPGTNQRKVDLTAEDSKLLTIISSVADEHGIIRIPRERFPSLALTILGLLGKGAFRPIEITVDLWVFAVTQGDQS